jgi:hypothetical protein
VGLGTAFLIFPLFKVPRFLRQAAASLLTAELVALLVHSYGSEYCDPSVCSASTQVAGTIASVDVPPRGPALLPGPGHGVRAASSPDEAVEDGQHVLAMTGPKRTIQPLSPSSRTETDSPAP